MRALLQRCGYLEDSSICIEEQRSDDPKINKLLRAASKAGNGVGRPEFIITSTTHSDFIVLVECKADPKKHISSTGTHYADYAVDGVLLYSSHLTKHFDVLAIAVSGESERELRVSHFLILRGTKDAKPIFGQTILPFKDYYDGYSTDPRKFNQDYERLLAYTRDLNEMLHAKKVKESQRSLLISGVLIALRNRAFESSYRQHGKAKNLAAALVNTILEELADSDLPSSKLESL